jgi:hypothetical protein
MTDDALIARLDRLEKRCRRQRLWLFLMTLAILLLATAMPFSLVRNPFGRIRVAMQAIGETSTMTLWDGRGNSRLELGVTPKGGAIHILGREGRTRISLATNERGEKDVPILLIYDATSPQATFQVDLLNQGSPQLVMTSPVGKGRVELTFLPNGDPILRLRGNDGTVIFQTPHPDDSVAPPLEPEK